MGLWKVSRHTENSYNYNSTHRTGSPVWRELILSGQTQFNTPLDSDELQYSLITGMCRFAVLCITGL